MEVFGRAPYVPSTTLELLVFVSMLAVVAVTVSYAADVPGAVLAVLAAIVAFLFDSAFFIPLAIALAGLIALLSRGRTVVEHPTRRAVREGIYCFGGFTLYEIGRHLTQSDWQSAIANSERIIAWQHWIGLTPEQAAQRLILRSEELTRYVNSAYSWLFLPVVAGTLFWVYITNEPVYRRFRNSLGISAGLAVVIIALFPAAPPRLTPGSGLIGTHTYMGGSHSFVNQFAAVPSLHVGWVAISCVALFVSVRHWLRWFWLTVPLFAMLFIVMSTGHHYWFDGLVGSLIAVVPFLIMTRRAAKREAAQPVRERQHGRVARWANAAAREVAEQPKVRLTTYTLFLLLTYLIVRQIVDPGFTDYWGYMVAQIAISIVLILWVSVHFAPQGGLSWVTHLIVVITTYADTLGTAGHMYSRYVTYDKITHFLGAAAVASALGDIFLAMRRKGTLSWSIQRAMSVAVVLAITLALGWEGYEYLGDKVFNTGRHDGAEDTIYDVISDTAGAIVAASLLVWWHTSSAAQALQHRPEPIAVEVHREE
jgi:hypothetical protein